MRKKETLAVFGSLIATVLLSAIHLFVQKTTIGYASLKQMFFWNLFSFSLPLVLFVLVYSAEQYGLLLSRIYGILLIGIGIYAIYFSVTVSELSSGWSVMLSCFSVVNGFVMAYFSWERN